MAKPLVARAASHCKNPAHGKKKTKTERKACIRSFIRRHSKK